MNRDHGETWTGLIMTLKSGSKNVPLATINDISKLAGVSKSTVSRVLGGGSQVSAATKQKVENAIRTLDYRPSALARGLALRRTNNIALIVQDIRNPYYSIASWVVERFFRARGYYIIIFNADNDGNLERELLENARDRGAEGVLSIGGDKDATGVIDFYSRHHIPMVLIDRDVKGYKIPVINLDNRLGGMLATDYLFALGHRKILFATSDFTIAEMQRREGYVNSCQKHGVPTAHSILCQPEESWDKGDCPELSQMISDGNTPTAIFASTDFKAFQVMRVLHQHNLQVPTDVSLIGYDDTYIGSITTPSLTTIRQPVEEMISTAASMLLHLIDGTPEGHVVQVFKPELIIRNSTGAVS